MCRTRTWLLEAARLKTVYFKLSGGYKFAHTTKKLLTRQNIAVPYKPGTPTYCPKIMLIGPLELYHPTYIQIYTQLLYVTYLNGLVAAKAKRQRSTPQLHNNNIIHGGKQAATHVETCSPSRIVLPPDDPVTDQSLVISRPNTRTLSQSTATLMRLRGLT